MTVTEKLKNLIVFGKVCLPQTMIVKSSTFHYEVAAYLMDTSVRFLNVIAPRGHAKSSLVGAVFVLYHIFMQKFAAERHLVVLVSKTEGHAIRLLQTIKDVLEYSQTFRAIFGYHGRYNAQQWKETQIVLDTGDVIITRGTGQMMVGMKFGNQRPTLIVVDDPEDMNNTKTAESMEFNLRWLLQAVVPSLDPRFGRCVVIGTPQHERCIVEVLKDTSGWKTLHYKAIIDMGGPEERALWPEWKNLEALYGEKRQYESIGRVDVFYREYQCEVIGGENRLFRPENIRYWDGYLTHQREGEAFLHITSLDDRSENLVIPVTVAMGIDPASSTSGSADFSVIFPRALDAEGNHYILPYYRARVTPMEFAEKVVEWYDTYRPRKTSVEATGYQEMLRDYLRSRKFIPGIEVKWQPRDRKNTRLESLQPRFVQRKVFIMRHMKEFVDELIMYPKSKFDDIMDAYWYANRGESAPYHQKEEVREFTDHQKYYVGLTDELDIAEAEMEREREEMAKELDKELRFAYIGR